MVMGRTIAKDDEAAQDSLLPLALRDIVHPASRDRCSVAWIVTFDNAHIRCRKAHGHEGIHSAFWNGNADPTLDPRVHSYLPNGA